MQQNTYDAKLKRSIFLPVLFFLIIWIIKLFEVVFSTSFAKLGVFPQQWQGLQGIFFAPFLHTDFSHLLSNSIPILILGAMVFFFFPKSGIKAIALIWLLGGFCVWLFARPSYHIGASGIIFGLASFIFFSGLLHKKKQLYAVSLIIVFLYGSTIQGVLPTDTHISWESHLSGFIVGIFTAFLFRKDKPYSATKYEPTRFDDYENISITETETGKKYASIEYFFADKVSENKTKNE